MFTQINIDLISVEEGDQTIGIRIDPAGGALPASLILRGKYDLPDNDTYPFDHVCFEKVCSDVQEVFEAAALFPGFSSTVPESLHKTKPQETGYSLISMT